MAAMDQADVDRLVKRLGPHGKAVGAAAKAGDSLAARIIEGYKMVCRCPEHGALVITEAALDEWLAKEGSPHRD